jgi:hypothetical protein
MLKQDSSATVQAPPAKASRSKHKPKVSGKTQHRSGFEQDGRGSRTSADLRLVEGTRNAERTLARGGAENAASAMLPLFCAIRSTIRMFGIQQVQICRVTDELNTTYGFPRISAEQLCKFLNGNRDLSGQTIESLDTALFIVNPQAFSYYRSLCDVDRELIATQYRAKFNAPK